MYLPLTDANAMTGPSPKFLTIPSKHNSPISHTFFPAIKEPVSPKFLVVFVNGLGLPASGWLHSVNLLRSQKTYTPAILTYDRFGQGLTKSRDPIDGTPGKEDGHDYLDVVRDLHEIITTIAKVKLNVEKADLEAGKLPLLLIGHSIGGPITRLYTQNHPNIVAGAVILDSNIANVNYSDFIPDPDAPGFDPAIVIPPDCTLEQYRKARHDLVTIFDLNVKNAESLDRSTGPSFLPYDDSPKLVGVDGKGLLLSIVGHDPLTFAEGSLEKMGTPKSLTMKFTNAYWAKYNEGLTKITDEDRLLSDGVDIAKGCGHFIQTDHPVFVTKQIQRLISASLNRAGIQENKEHKEGGKGKWLSSI